MRDVFGQVMQVRMHWNVSKQNNSKIILKAHKQNLADIECEFQIFFYWRDLFESLVKSKINLAIAETSVLIINYSMQYKNTKI